MMAIRPAYEDFLAFGDYGREWRPGGKKNGYMNFARLRVSSFRVATMRNTTHLSYNGDAFRD